jgi:trimeric autotransporter adhesin
MHTLFVWSKFFFLMAFILVSNAVFAGPARTTYQARIIKPDGQPLEASTVAFKFSILDPSATCVLYAEDYSLVNMTNSGGLISFSLGSGNRIFPTSGTAQTFQNTFDNSVTSFSCQSPGIYNPVSTDTRKIVMQFNDGNGWQTLPAMSINAVPYAMFAAKTENASTLNGKSDAAFVERSSLPTCLSGEALVFNGATFSCIAAGGGSATVTSGSVITALGYTPADGASLTAVTSSVLLVSSTVFSVSSTVSNLSSVVSSLSSTVFGLTSTQWISSGTSISYSLGNVGIGTSEPTATLDVSGTVRIRTGNPQAGFVLTSDASGTASWQSPSGVTSAAIVSALGYTPVNTANNFSDLASATQARNNLGLGILATQNSLSSIDVTSGLGYTPTSAAAVMSEINNAVSGIVSSQWVSSGSTINYANGKVGIGTSSPTSVLHVEESFDSQPVAKIINNSSTNGEGLTVETAEGAANGNAFKIVTYRTVSPRNMIRVTNGSASNIYLAESGGNVGIGTSSPVNKLDVSGNMAIGTYAGSYSAPTNGMIISGNVGVGTSSPAARLSIISNSAGTPALSLGGKDLTPADLQWSQLANERTMMLTGASGTAGYGVYVSVSNDVEAAGKNLGYYSFGQQVAGKSGDDPGLKAGISAVTAGGGGTVGGYGADIVFYTKNDNSALTWSEKMRLTASGSLGVGVNNPGSSLEVSGAIRSSAGLAFRNAANWNMTIAAGDVYNYGANEWLVYSARGGHSFIIDNDNSNTSVDNFEIFGTTSATSLLRVQKNGNVGIGTTTPVTRLEVSGGLRISMESATCAVSYAGTLRYNSGNVEFCNGTTWSAFGVSGAGITSLNGSTSATQTFAYGAEGTTTSFSTLNGVHTLNIPLASAASVTGGLLSNVDYLNFTNKITSSAASIAQVLGYVPANSATTLTTSNGLLKANNLSDLTSSATARNNLGLGGFATVSNLDLGSASATGTLDAARLPALNGDVSSVSGSASVNVVALRGVSVSSTAPTSGQVLAYNGLAWAPSTISGGGGSSQWITNGADIYYNSGNVVVGTATTPTASMHLLFPTGVASPWTKQLLLESANTGGTSIDLKNTGAGGREWSIISNGSSNTGGAGMLQIYDNTGSATRFLMDSSGRVRLGSTAPTNTLSVTGSADFLGNVGIGVTSPTAKLHISSGTTTTAPLKFTSGTLLTSAQSGTMEFDGFNFFLTDGANTRSRIITSVNTSPTSGQVLAFNGTAWAPATNSGGGSQWTTSGTTIHYVTGNVGIGTVNPNQALTVSGTAGNASSFLNSTATIDFSKGNLQYTNASCQAFQLNNMKDGTAYTFAVKGATAALCSFTAFTGVGTGALTVHMPTDHTNSIASKHTLYTMLVIGSDVYVSWTPGL